MMPISIIIPTFNREKLLEWSVRSALTALPEGGEVIVVDDHSSTPAAETLAGFAPDRALGRLRVVLNGQGKGPAAARNHGVAQAQGKLVLFLDDDDLLHPDYPAAVVQMQAKGFGFGFAKIQRFQDGTQPAAQSHDDVAPVPLSALPFKAQLGGLGCGFWVERALFETVGGINPLLRVNEDTDLSLRLLKSGALGGYLPKIAAYVRDHNTASAHLTHGTPAALRASYFKILLEDHAPWLAKNPDARQFLLRRYVKMLAKSGDGSALIAGLRWGAAGPGLWAYGLANFLLYRVKG